MAKTDIESKVRALLARATDGGASEEERRTSASLAAELMKKHDLVLKPRVERAAAKASPAPPPPPVSKPQPTPFEVMLERLRKEAVEREAAKTPTQRAAEKAAREREKLELDFTMAMADLGRAFAKKYF